MDNRPCMHVLEGLGELIDNESDMDVLQDSLRNDVM